MKNLITQTGTGSIAPLIVILFLLVLSIIFCFKMAISASKANKKAKLERKKQIQQRQASLAIPMSHVNGLPVNENAFCTVYSVPGKYEIVCSGNTFNLDKNKVTDMIIKNETEITSQYVSSVGGAVGGAILFGPLGAVIGGRAKEKKTKESKQYLIITYESDGQIKYIGFDVTANFKAFELVKEFNSMKSKHSSTINL